MMFQKKLRHFRSDQHQSSHPYSDTGTLEKRQFLSDKIEDDKRRGADALLRIVLRRFSVALATLRLTGTTSTTALTATSATTSTTALGYSLKLILVGCFYIVAFASILMLILHINHHVATTTAQKTHQAETHHQRNANQRKNSSIEPTMILSDDDDQPLVRIKRSSPTFKGAAAGATARSLYYYPAIGASKTSPARINNHNLQHQRTKAFNQINTSRGANVGGRKSNNRTPLSAHGYGRTLSRQNSVKTLPSASRQLNKVGTTDVASSSIWSVALPAAAGITHQAAATSTTKRLPEIGQANYSPNNRGSMNSSSLLPLASVPSTSAVASPNMSQPSEGQWIPILNQPGSARQHNEPQATVASQQVSAQQIKPQQQQKSRPIQYQQLQSRQRQRQHQQQKLLQQQPSQTAQTVLGAPTTTVGVSIEATYRTADGNNNYYYNQNDRDRPRSWRHQVDPNFYKDRWRMPRYNTIGHENLEAMRPNKLYKRVLLCDKTLVSLDYVSNFELEPRPFDSSFDDNIIDLGSSLDPILLDRRMSNSTSQSSSSSSATTTTTTKQQPITTTTTMPTVSSSLATGSLDSGDQLLAARTDSVIAAIVSEGEQPAARRSYLTDEDPLVRCDMWDLEKGLKNRKPPMEILRMAVKADFDTVRDAINRCRQLTEKTLPPDDEFRDGIEIMSTDDLVSLFSMKRGLIPGTKWCGLGDQASSYNDLGPKHRIDICCRAHDHCPIRLKPFRNDYGVLNIALYTKSHCDCDADFYRCLREAHSRTADMLGNLYFNVMKLQCMREERMKICREMKPIALGFERCVKYEDSPVKRVFRFTTPPVAY